MAVIAPMHLESSDGSERMGPVEVESLGDNRFRIHATTLIDDVGYRDVVEADVVGVSTIRICRVVEKSNWRTLGFMLPRRIVESGGLTAVLDRVTARGGEWERMMGGCLFVHLPPGVDWDPSDELDAL